MSEPIGTTKRGANGPGMRRPAVTQPLDPSVLGRSTKELALAGRAQTSELEGLPPENANLKSSIFKAMKDFVSSLVEPGRRPLEGGPSTLPLQVDQGLAGLRDSDPSWPAELQVPESGTWGMVSMDSGRTETATNTSTAGREVGLRDWGMVAMDEPATSGRSSVQSNDAAGSQIQVGGTRNWGMVSMTEEAATVTTPENKVEAELLPKDETSIDPVASAQAKVAALKKLVDPKIGVLLDQLEAQGKLDLRSEKGLDVLAGLTDLATMTASPTALGLGFSNKGIVEQTIRDLADPLGIQQKGESDCVWTNLRFHLSKDSPGQYVELARNLYRDGEALLAGGGRVKLEEALKPFDLAGKIGKTWYQNGELWMQYQGLPAMPAQELVGTFLNDRAWVDRTLRKMGLDEVPFFKDLIENLRDRWNNGEKQAALEMAAPFLQLVVQIEPEDEAAAGMQYALNNIRSLLKPAAQAAEALPKGLPLGRVDEFLAGSKGYYYDKPVDLIVKQAARRGAKVPVAFSTDDGKGLHLATILGYGGPGLLIIYDPENGARSLPEDVFEQRAKAVFLPPELGKGLSEVPDTDEQPVAGGRFSWRTVYG